MTVITTTVTIVIARPFLLPRVNKAGGFRDEAWPLYNLKPKEVGSTREGEGGGRGPRWNEYNNNGGAADPRSEIHGA